MTKNKLTKAIETDWWVVQLIEIPDRDFIPEKMDKIDERIENVNKEAETIQYNQMDIQNWKKWVYEIKNSLDWFNRRPEIKESIIKLESSSRENTQFKKRVKK